MRDDVFLGYATDPAFIQRCIALDDRLERESMTVQECADVLEMPVHLFAMMFGPLFLPHIIVPPVQPIGTRH